MRSTWVRVLLVLLGCGLLTLGSATLAMRGAATPSTAALYTPLISQHDPAGSAVAATATQEPPPTTTLGPTVTETATQGPTATSEATATATATQTTVVASTATSTATPTQPAENDLLEPFEGPIGGWQLQRDTAGGGSVTQSGAHAAAGSFAARATTNSAAGVAQVRSSFSDAAGDHQWQERPGTYHWQRASVYLPASTLAQLGAGEYLTLAGFWASGANTGWYLRVGQGGALSVVGQRDFDGQAIAFNVYGSLPTERWVSLEIGLHSQAGPGVKRAFSFLIDGDFYGWYHQGRMKDETYNRAALGILGTNSADALEIFIDQWRSAGTAALPTGPDNRSTANVQEQDFRTTSGVQWQIDWATWENDLRLDAQYGLYSNSSRLQSGRNLDRMPDLTSGWADIEIDWVGGSTPPMPSSEYFGAMVGFRKEINREENFEIIPYRDPADSKLYLVFEAWVGGPVILARWPLPGNSVPGAGDIIRTRWEQVSATNLRVRASYYDASAASWSSDIIDWSGNITAISNGSNTVDYTDGYHGASSITIDSQYYSIRRYKVGILATYPN